MSDKLKAVGILQKQLMGAHYARALDAKREGRPVVYVTAMFPVEIVKAFEPHIATVYPENHAAMLSANGKEYLAQEAIAAGLDRMGCAYELINTGYLLAGHGRLDAPDLTIVKGRKGEEKETALHKLPEPDILLSCNNQCEVVCEWFKHLSEALGNKPYRTVNVGNRYDGSVGEERTAFVRRQIEDVIMFLEQETGTSLDRDKLLEVAKKSNEAIKLWREYLNLGTLKPSPMTAFDGFYHMALIVSERGTDAAKGYYHDLVEATRALADARVAAVEKEEHRVLWDNLATWYNFGELKRYLAERRVAVVGSTYLDIWKTELDTSGYDGLLDSMAKAYSVMYTNMTIPERIEYYREHIERFDAEGVLFHNNLSCHTFSLRVAHIADALRKEGIKCVLFEGCQGLKDRFQKHAFEMGIETYFHSRLT